MHVPVQWVTARASGRRCNRRVKRSSNGRARNLADPEYEPTDEELRELAHSAFADVASRNAEALRRVHAEIEKSRVELMKRLPALLLVSSSESAE